MTDAPEGVTPHVIPEDEAWVEGRSLAETVEDLELIDPAVSSERLLYRLWLMGDPPRPMKKEVHLYQNRSGRMGVDPQDGRGPR